MARSHRIESRMTCLRPVAQSTERRRSFLPRQTHSLLSGLGFPVPGAATWIDFSQPYSDQAEEAMVRGMLQAAWGRIGVGW